MPKNKQLIKHLVKCRVLLLCLKGGKTHEMPVYDIRAMEQSIRQSKRELAGYDEAIKHADDNDALKKDFQTSFERTSVKLKQQEAKYKEFSYAVNQRPDNIRTQVQGFDKSVSQKAVWANKKALNIQQENDIIKEIKSLGISGNIKLHPSELNFDNISFDGKHINVREHNVTKDEALNFIKQARFSAVRWNGKFENYYSEEGATFVNVEKNEIRTAFKREEFTNEIIKALEVLKKHGK